MNYDIKPKPTYYKDRLYRSRLEARWAAFFSFHDWDVEYEPFDLEGWTPDFLIKGYKNTLVEVKPTLEMAIAASKKIKKFYLRKYNYLFLLNGPIVGQGLHGECLGLGYMAGGKSFEFKFVEFMSTDHGMSFLNPFDNSKDDIYGAYSEEDRTCSYYKHIELPSNFEGWIENMIKFDWITSANEVMFLKPEVDNG